MPFVTHFQNNESDRRRAHRWFGWVALVVLCGHIGMAAIMAWNNPVKQHAVIKLFYIIYIIENGLRRPYQGMKCAFSSQAVREHDEAASNNFRNQHKSLMVRMYVWTTFGSGAIRLSAWILWCIGKFFP